MIECNNSCNDDFSRYRLKISEDEIFFGTVLVGNVSPAFEITLENVGWEDILFQSLSITGPFTLVRTKCPDVLKPGQEGRITVKFTPTAFGPWTGAVFIKAGRTGDHNIRLVGAAYNNNENGDDLSGIPIFLTRADLEENANLVYPNGTYTLVISDPVLANNDFYQKIGDSGEGSWSEPLGQLSTIILNGEIDLENLDNVINGAANLVNPGHPAGTVTLRNGQTYRTLANILGSQVAQEQQATIEADRAELAANEALASASVSEIARDVALTAGPYYLSQASGEGATTEGQEFAVVIADSPTWYRRTASGSDVIFTPATTASLAAAGGAGMIGWIGGLIGSMVRTISTKLSDVVSLKDFGAVGDGVADDTAAVQAFFNAIGSNAFGGRRGYIPTGIYRLTSSINLTKIYSYAYGEGKFMSVFKADEVVGSVFKCGAMTYFKPQWRDFSIFDDTLTTTGRGIDMWDVVAECYDLELTNMYIKVKGDALASRHIFSGKIENVTAHSENGHSFLVHCGPAVTWINTYAATCGPDKAGYRLSGQINMIGPNGLNEGGWWGVFGHDPAGTEGFQNDFIDVSPGLLYPSVHIKGGNVEQFTVEGVLIDAPFLMVQMDDIKFDRAGLNTNYRSVMRSRYAGVANTAPVRMTASLNAGAGVPKGPADTLTNAWFYAHAGGIIFEDLTGALQAAKGGYYNVAYAGLVPFVTETAGVDFFQNAAKVVSAIMPRRLTVQNMSYNTGAVITPVGAAQAIDVTGRTKVLVTPVAAASISTATFTATLGAISDYGRNGDLIIEAGNANLTINHAAAGANTFKLKGGANVVMAAGEVRAFMRSSTGANWWEI